MVTTALIEPIRLISGAMMTSGAVSKGFRLTRLSSRPGSVVGAKSRVAGAADNEVLISSNSAVIQILVIISSLSTGVGQTLFSRYGY
jgi:hypothetical protein